MPPKFADTRRNWPRSRPTSYWPTVPRPWACCSDPYRADRVPAAVDPVGAGFVDSLSRHGGNATGFTGLEYSLGAKWLELLKQIAPGVTRAAVIQDPAITDGIGQFGAIQAVAPSVGVEVSPVNVRDAGEIERAVAAITATSVLS